MAEKKVDMRLAALRRFAIAITAFNLLGHTLLGFEQAWAHPFVALVTAYLAELILETLDARSKRRTPRYAGGPLALINFLLPAHITGLAVAMLLYSGSRLAPIAFASIVAIGSKYIVQIPVGRGSRHLFNPSNLGITLTLLLFPWVGIAPPYMFTEGLTGAGDWLLPAFIVVSGSFLNARFTRRIPLITAWLSVFALQAIARSLFFDTPMLAALAPMTGVAFLLFTFYMVTDPATTPFEPRRQVLFGAAVALAYCMLMLTHIVFGLFFALTAVSVVRGLGLYLARLRQLDLQPDVPVAVAGTVGRAGE